MIVCILVYYNTEVCSYHNLTNLKSDFFSSRAEYDTFWNDFVPIRATYFPPSCSSLTACSTCPSSVQRRFAGVVRQLFSVTSSRTYSHDPIIRRGMRTLAPRYLSSPFRNTLWGNNNISGWKEETKYLLDHTWFLNEFPVPSGCNHNASRISSRQGHELYNENVEHSMEYWNGCTNLSLLSSS